MFLINNYIIAYPLKIRQLFSLARNFKCVKSIPNRFVTTEFIEKWTEGQGCQNLDLRAINDRNEVFLKKII